MTTTTDPYWWQNPTILEREEEGYRKILSRGQEHLMGNRVDSAGREVLGLPSVHVPLNKVIETGDYMAIPRQAVNLGRAEIAEFKNLFNPATYDFNANDLWQERARAKEVELARDLGRQSSAYADELKARTSAPGYKKDWFGGNERKVEAKVAEQLGRQSDNYGDILRQLDISKGADGVEVVGDIAQSIKPGTIATATEVGTKLLGKGLKAAGNVAPFIGAGYQLHHEVNPLEVGVRTALDWGGSLLGMAAGGSLGAATAFVTGPVGAMAGTVGGAIAGSTAADWVADRIFGDEAPRIQAVKERRAQEEQIGQQKAMELDQMESAMRGARQAQRDRYLAAQFLPQGQGQASPWTTPYTDQYMSGAAPKYI